MLWRSRADLWGAVAVAGAGVLIASAAPGQDFTTAAEVKPILTVTRASWIAIRPDDGNDLLYFTNALAWRCGISEIRYGLNGAAAVTVLAMEPCYEGEATPNALKMDRGIMPYVLLPLESVESVTVVVVFDDGSEEPANYQRKAVLIP